MDNAEEMASGSNSKRKGTSCSKAPAKKAKRRRRKRNEVVEVDIADPPGEDCENWKRIAKEKLRERESQLMGVRMRTLRNVIREQCTAFETLNSSLHQGTQRVTVLDSEHLIPDELTTECMDKLNISLKYWNGVNMTKTKRSLDSFRDYYVISRNWFDCQKRNTLGPVFWIRTFRILEQFVVDSADSYFKGRLKDLQKLYAKHLLFQVLRGIFGAEIHFFEQKVQPLVPGTILKDCDPMKEYLGQLDPALDVTKISQVIYIRVLTLNAVLHSDSPNSFHLTPSLLSSASALSLYLCVCVSLFVARFYSL